MNTTNQASSQDIIIDLQGRIQELVEQNSNLTQRCALMRGQLTLKDTEISRLLTQVTQLRAREEEAKAVPEPEKPPPSGMASMLSMSHSD